MGSSDGPPQDWGNLPVLRILVGTVLLIGVIVAIGFFLTGFPPGVSEEGVNTSLANTHNSQLTSLNSLTYSASTVRLTEDGVQNISYQLHADLEEKEYLARKSTGDTVITTYYANGTAYRRVRNASGTFYTTRSNASSPMAQIREFNRTIRTVAMAGNFSFEGRTLIGTDIGYRYAADDVAPIVTGSLPAKNVTAELVVDSHGLVRIFRLKLSVRTVNITQKVVIQAQFTNLNQTTVPRPEWVDKTERSKQTNTPPSQSYIKLEQNISQAEIIYKQDETA